MKKRRERSEKRVVNDFYCTWGKHYTQTLPHIKEQFEQGTICLICQLDILTELTDRVDFKEMRSMLTMTEVTRDIKASDRRRATRKVDPKGEGFVYYMRMNNQIKIGFATDVTKRMRAYPPDTELIAVEPGTLEKERDRHIEFKGELVRGREWFRETARLTGLMERLRQRHGNPEVLAYKYTRHAGNT